MSQYCQQSDLTGIIPNQYLIEATDDTNAGVVNTATLTQIITDCSAAIDAILGTRFSVPFVPDENGNYPPFIFNACKKLVAEQLYKRRGIAPGENPWTAECNALRDLMNKMALGLAPLDPSINREDPSASMVTEPAKTAPRHGDTLSV
ncbi:MAG TPA: phage protein Gp36 family protein [Candidatus Methylacidiphilales bacterium]|nr:phage protein Gp36 family protein [Candidatus Methylacidiphilales bacterium]